MAWSAKRLFSENLVGAEENITIYDAIEKISPRLHLSWLLRSVVVYSISALDAYFHDKIRYRAGHIDLSDMPNDYAEFQIPIKEVIRWVAADRKGNIQRDWFINHYATRPLQKKDEIAKAMKLMGYNDFWATVEPNSPARDEMLLTLAGYVDRRNKIVHEGDRLQHRSGGKQPRDIDREYAQACMDYVRQLVDKIEPVFPG